MYYDDEELYFEPSQTDEILIEYQTKMKEILLDNIKSEIENIKNENARLKEENKKLKDKQNEIDRKERDLKYKEDILKREVEKEFYDSNIGETLKRYIEDCELWFADPTRYQKEKCNLCDKNRKLVARYPNGKKIASDCDCAKFYTKYKPCKTEEQVIKFYKKNSNYSSERRFYFAKSYTPSKNSSYYDDAYSEFKIKHIIDEFNDGIKEIYKDLHYGEKLGFRNIDECQKFCDWLNENIEKKEE